LCFTRRKPLPPCWHAVVDGGVGSHKHDQAKDRGLCRATGHDLTPVIVPPFLAPAAIVCGRCGTTYRIHPADLDKDFDDE
jgi:hypothetical protein